MTRCVANAIFLTAALAPIHAQHVIGIPPQAHIFEFHPLPATLHPHRALLLWADSPSDHPRGKRDSSGRLTASDIPYTCPEFSRGWFRRGPTRISLVDTQRRAVINTVKVVADSGADTFDIPYWIEAGHFYEVPATPSGREGKPSILALRDIDGDGVAAEFQLYDMPACTGPDTYVFGYQPQRDRLAHYAFELTGSGGASTVAGFNRFFHQKPVRPREWDFRLTTNDGSECAYRLRFLPLAAKFTGTMRCRRLP